MSEPKHDTFICYCLDGASGGPLHPVSSVFSVGVRYQLRMAHCTLLVLTQVVPEEAAPSLQTDNFLEKAAPLEIANR